MLDVGERLPVGDTIVRPNEGIGASVRRGSGRAYSFERTGQRDRPAPERREDLAACGGRSFWVVRYSLSLKSPGEWRILSAQSNVRTASAFGDGIIAETTDESLGREIVSKLNEIDPEPRRAFRRGFGWW